jgi:predicted N-acetyltransferase YhbS
VREASPLEAETIAEVVRRSFQTVADEVGVDIPPIHESAAEVLASFQAGEAILVALSESGQIVGTVRGESLGDGSVMVRRLAVLPEWRGQGIGGALVRACEAAYPDARRFELFTGAGPEGAVDLYERLGYVHMPPQEIDGFPLTYMEKHR